MTPNSVTPHESVVSCKEVELTPGEACERDLENVEVHCPSCPSCHPNHTFDAGSLGILSPCEPSGGGSP